MATNTEDQYQKFMSDPTNSCSLKDLLAIMHGYHKEQGDKLTEIQKATELLVSRLEAVEEELVEIKVRLAEPDPCEIRFKGVSCASLENHKAAITTILAANYPQLN